MDIREELTNFISKIELLQEYGGLQRVGYTDAHWIVNQLLEKYNIQKINE